MIKHIMIFKESGILIFEKILEDQREIIKNSAKNSRELVSGFLSAIFQFFSNHYGELQTIKSSNYLILVDKIEKIYLVLFIKIPNSTRKQDENSNLIFNKRIEKLAYICMENLKTNLTKNSKILFDEYEKIFIKSDLIEEIDTNLTPIIKEFTQKMHFMDDILHNRFEKQNFSNVNQRGIDPPCSSEPDV